MKKFVVIFLSMVALFSILLTACGGSAGSSTATTSKVTMTDFAFDPKEIVVSAGKDVSLTIENKGSVAHDFTVVSKSVTAPFDMEANKADVIFTINVPAGQTSTAKFTAPAAGTYQVICAVPGHLEAGMEAKLVAK